MSTPDEFVTATVHRGDQLTKFRRLEEDAALYGVKVYPLGDASLYLVAPGGFHLCAPTLEAAAKAVRQLRAARG